MNTEELPRSVRELLERTNGILDIRRRTPPKPGERFNEFFATWYSISLIPGVFPFPGSGRSATAASTFWSKGKGSATPSR